MSEQFKQFIEGGDWETFKAKMQLRQMVNVDSTHPAACKLPSRPPVGADSVRKPGLEWRGSTESLTEAIQATHAFDGSLLVAYFEFTATKIPDKG